MRGGLSCAIVKKTKLGGILVGTGKCVTTAGNEDGDEDTNIEWMDIVAMKAKVESNSKLFHTSA